jgi:outer membrane protein TolC
MRTKPINFSLLVVGGVLVCSVWGSAAARGPSQQQSTPTFESRGQNPFLGSVPSGEAGKEPLKLSLSGAIERGLSHNLALLLGQQGARRAAGLRWVDLSDLLPDLSAGVTWSREKVNLEAFGFPLPEGIPPVVGPFNVVDARLRLSQTIFDYAALERAREGKQELASAKFSYDDARNTVVFVCAGLYLQAVAVASRVEAARAQLRTAEALYQRAVDRKAAGTVAAIGVLRAQVELESERQRTILLESELQKQHLVLARAIGVSLEQPLELVDAIPYSPPPSSSREESLEQAYRTRSDFKQAQSLVKAAEAKKRAALGEALPSVGLYADYGEIGLSLDTARTTFTLVAELEVPLFQGGRVHGRRLEADALLQQRRAEMEDLRGRIDYEVRSALLDIEASDERVRVAESARSLAEQQLTQAQDRFSAGVVSNIEVVLAQQALASATESYISSLYEYNLAKLSLALALGVAEEQAEQFVKGNN